MSPTDSVSEPCCSDAPLVRVCDTSSVRDPALLDRYRALLDPEESRRLQRFRFERDRHCFLVSHALLRVTLAAQTGRAPEALRFGTGEHGKPFLLDVRGLPAATPVFNLSHSGSHAAVVIHEGPGAIGVDIEQHRRDRRFDALAARHFARAEILQLGELDPARRTCRFYDVWTLKESYIKAVGAGLRMPLTDFSFTFGEPGIGFDVAPALDPRPERWRFWCARLGGAFSISLALDSGSAAAAALRPRLLNTVPLGASTPLMVEGAMTRSR